IIYIPQTATKDVKDEMKIKLHMDGDVNGYKFKIEGNGQGRPYEGVQTINLTVTNGGPLPFAFDILTAAFEYGNRVFTQYPPDIPDYFKQTFPDGYSWERTMEFEDGAKCEVKSVISLPKAGCFEYKIVFNGMGFPPNGPVMQKKTVKWEPSTEMMYMCGGELKGDVNMALLLEDGSHHRCDFKSTYKAKKPGIQLPKYHYIDHRIEILEQKDNYNQVVLYEKAAARYSPFPNSGFVEVHLFCLFGLFECVFLRTWRVTFFVNTVNKSVNFFPWFLECIPDLSRVGYRSTGAFIMNIYIRYTKAGCFEYKIVFNGMGFPPNGPVMQKKTVKWEPSTEMMYMCGGELKGDVNMALLLEDGSHHRCDFKSTYKAKKPGIQLPKYHYIDHRIEILEQKDNYNQVVLYEKAAARYSPYPQRTQSRVAIHPGDLEESRSKTTRTVRFISYFKSTIMTATKDVKDEMKIKLHMDGDVNGYMFKIEGNGQGRPYEGVQTINLTVTNGGPLPFAYDILTAAFEYGNRVFTQYPPDIPDYFKQTFPDGYSWERTMEFEDGAKCEVKSVISLPKAGCFEYKIVFNGMGFPPNGPVMQKKTVKWEPSTEMMYMCGGELKGDVNMALLLEDGSHHRCDFKSTYKAKKPGIQLPKYHYIDHRIEILEQKDNYNQVVLYEKAAARYSPFPVKAAK
ncbi:unnamed protein product, partial [Porites evermanni]